MLCPACLNVEMFVLEFEHVEIDFCMECRGVWLDSGELEILGRRAGAIHGELLKALESDIIARKSKLRRRCPVCRKRLEAVDVAATPPIEVDRCPRGHGLWFDKGELPAVVAAAGAAPDHILARFLADLVRAPEKSKEEEKKGL